MARAAGVAAAGDRADAGRLHLRRRPPVRTRGGVHAVGPDHPALGVGQRPGRRRPAPAGGRAGDRGRTGRGDDRGPPRSAGTCRAARCSTPWPGRPVSLSQPLSLLVGGSRAEVRIVARLHRRGMHRLAPPSLVVHDTLELARVMQDRQRTASGAADPAPDRARAVAGKRTGRALRRAAGPDSARRADGRRRRRWAAPVPPRHARLADPLGGAGPRRRPARAPAATRRRHPPAGRARRARQRTDRASWTPPYVRQRR